MLTGRNMFSAPTPLTSLKWCRCYARGHKRGSSTNKMRLWVDLKNYQHKQFHVPRTPKTSETRALTWSLARSARIPGPGCSADTWNNTGVSENAGRQQKEASRKYKFGSTIGRPCAVTYDGHMPRANHREPFRCTNDPPSQPAISARLLMTHSEERPVRSSKIPAGSVCMPLSSRYLRDALMGIRSKMS